MNPELLAAIVDAIKLGCLAKDSPLSVLEFETIHRATLRAVEIARRQFAIEVTNCIRQDMREKIQSLAKRV